MVEGTLLHGTSYRRIWNTTNPKTRNVIKNKQDLDMEALVHAIMHLEIPNRNDHQRNSIKFIRPLESTIQITQR